MRIEPRTAESAFRKNRLLRVFLILFLTLWAVSLNSININAQCLQPGFSPGAVSTTTGNPALDAKFHAEGNSLYSVFGVNPNMFIFNDGGWPNAYASPQITLPGFTGTVYFGLSLLRDELWSLNKDEVAVAGIMAHEFAHILQIKANNTLRGKFRELHADFLAGYYLRIKAYVTGVDIRGFAQSVYEKGDYNFWSPAHHGTPQERVAAMVAGYNTTGTLASAYNRGIQVVTSPMSEAVQTSSPEMSGMSAPAGNRSSQSAGDFAEALAKVIAESRSGFRRLKGVLDPDGDGEAWTANFMLPGAEECEVWVYRDPDMEPDYSCQMGRSNDQDRMATLYDRVLEQTRNSLSGDWAPGRPFDIARYIKNAVFRHSGTKARIVISLQRWIRSSYRVQLAVHAPPKD